jgi:ubiquitin carboxyl-terminal hydrolase 48
MQESFEQCAAISSQAELSNLLPSIFWGKSSITTKCFGCKSSSKRTDDFKFLAIPIVDVDAESSRPKGISNDVDVQKLLNISLMPELMDDDNKYSCSRCNRKCNATRTPSFESLPPVLNLQLNRYVFNTESFTKQKLTTKVLLPHTIKVPVQNESKTYMLVAVQNHHGNSAHAGHYVANAMDWSTGVWFEFNDEHVDVLENGPVSAFYPNQLPSDDDAKPRKKQISGSAVAYNLLYVEIGYLSTRTQADLVYCKESDAVINHIPGDPSFEESTYLLYSRMRLHHFEAEQE